MELPAVTCLGPHSEILFMSTLMHIEDEWTSNRQKDALRDPQDLLNFVVRRQERFSSMKVITPVSRRNELETIFCLPHPPTIMKVLAAAESLDRLPSWPQGALLDSICKGPKLLLQELLLLCLFKRVKGCLCYFCKCV